jgi:hypothetical protein
VAKPYAGKKTGRAAAAAITRENVMKMAAICAGAMLGMSGLFGAGAAQAAEIKVMASTTPMSS